MKRRGTRVKLSRAQMLENERNRWLAKRDGAIAMLVKAMGKLVKLDRSCARMERKAGARFGPDEKYKTPHEASAALVKQAAPMGMVNDGEPVIEPTPIPPLPVESAIERHKGEPATMVKLKAPRKRKPKAEAHLPADVVASVTVAAEAIREDREARMKSLGFRKTKR